MIFQRITSAPQDSGKDGDAHAPYNLYDGSTKECRQNINKSTIFLRLSGYVLFEVFS